VAERLSGGSYFRPAGPDEPMVQIPVGEAEAIAHALTSVRGLLRSLEAARAHLTQDPTEAGRATRVSPLTEFVIAAEERMLAHVDAAMPERAKP
jgi:hypothetical protein